MNIHQILQALREQSENLIIYCLNLDINKKEPLHAFSKRIEGQRQLLDDFKNEFIRHFKINQNGKSKTDTIVEYYMTRGKTSPIPDIILTCEKIQANAVILNDMYLNQKTEIKKETELLAWFGDAATKLKDIQKQI